MQRRIQLALALQKGPDEPFSVWVRVLPTVLDIMMGRWLLTCIYGHSRHKMDLHEIIEGEHWVKVKLFEGETWFEEGLRRNKS